MLYPVEAKALSTHDEVNLSQMRGELETLKKNYECLITPIACQMLEDGIRFAVFPIINVGNNIPEIMTPSRFYRITLYPKINSWRVNYRKNERRRVSGIPDLDTFSRANSIP
jgi:hypothetical protein